MLNVRLSISKETVEQLAETMRQAYRAGDAGMIKRTTALIRLSRHEASASIATELGCSEASIYDWLRKLVYEGVNGLKVKWRGGRPAKLTKRKSKGWWR